MTIKQFTKKVIKAINYDGEYDRMENAIGIMFAASRIGELKGWKMIFNEEDIKPAIKNIKHYIKQ